MTVLQFEGGICCHVFHEQVARILHHASTWSAVAGVTVAVIRLGECHDGPPAHVTDDLAVDLDVNTGDRVALAQLCTYLARVLGTKYRVELEPDRVHVEYYARGQR